MAKWILSLSLCMFIVGCTKSEPDMGLNYDPSNHNQQVVLVHGLARSGESMQAMSNMIKKLGYQVCVVDYPTLVMSVETTLEKSAAQIEHCVTQFKLQPTQAHQLREIHFVGHSLGGLMIRNYLGTHPNFVNSKMMGKVVFVGTPNHGSDVADFFAKFWLLPLAGDTAKSLTSQPNSLPNSLPKPNYEFGVIAGIHSYPILKYMFNNENDGLVSVKSARLEGMQDFIEVDVKHDSLRSDPHVTQLITRYISHGQFLDKGTETYSVH
ncbi:alpha/beta fold hydrolase [Vibrio gallicus]|uniref:alpha/beta fold hydrolase n=1 Tax=Vibrio gallicus TaxID=190897 RepID=UPI0021C3C72A|nr:alpha/beta fold hydrolase [Vibrio gallicus]